ncbi:MAG: hypothetical protein HYY16_09630 [Planctomycetes bacterium]|nr:hypothetical protein [Planctomycetota bacterium]
MDVLVKRPSISLLMLCSAAALGCSFAPGSRSGRIDPAAEPRAPMPPPLTDQHEFAPPEALQAGQWARYRVVRDDVEHELTLGVAARDGDRVWLEVVEEGDPRRASLRVVAPDGHIEKAFFREARAKGDPSVVVPQPLTQADPLPAIAPAEPVPSIAGQETVGGRSLTVILERLIFRDEELGREYQEEHVWSPDAPVLYAASEHGGLVRRQTAREKISLIEFGGDYKACIEAPR